MATILMGKSANGRILTRLVDCPINKLQFLMACDVVKFGMVPHWFATIPVELPSGNQTWHWHMALFVDDHPLQTSI